MAQFFKRILPTSVYEKARKALLFVPDDPNDLIQQVPQMHVKGVGIDRIKGYRYPAPGSQVAPNVPVYDSTDKYYSVNFFDSDTSKAVGLDSFMGLNTPSSSNVISMQEKRRLNRDKKTKPHPYDPEKTRSAKKVNQVVVNAIMAKYTPTHFDAPAWINHVDEIKADCERKGIPLTMGRVHEYALPKSFNTLHW